MSLSIFLSHIVSFPIFHNTKAKVNSPTSPKRRTARLILSPTRIKSKNGTKCEPQPANEVPGANVPAEHVERGNIPAFWVSSMKSVPERTKPRPPMTWGVQYILLGRVSGCGNGKSGKGE